MRDFNANLSISGKKEKKEKRLKFFFLGQSITKFKSNTKKEKVKDQNKIK